MTPELIYEWQNREHHSGESFVIDGIIDEQAWKLSPRRVLFLLKEAYDTNPESTGFDLRTTVREVWGGPPRRGRGTTWWKMGYWAYLLHNIDVDYTPSFPINREDVVNPLLSSAVVNIRKSGGQTSSDLETINSYAELDSDLLREQIEFIKPDVIIAGNVMSAVRRIWQDINDVSDRFYLLPFCPLVNFWHPAAHFNYQLMFFSLAGIIQAALTKRPDCLPSLN